MKRTDVELEGRSAGLPRPPSEEMAATLERDVNTSDYVYTGPGTLAGRYLRQHWQPVCTSTSLAPGTTAPLRVMGEDYTLYRDEDGRPHVVASRCPHRGTQLSTGLVEGSHLRCIYHGWMFDAGGQCIEQPGEPKPFCSKIRIASYPTIEHVGLIFAYFGPGTPPQSPPIPPEVEPYLVGAVMLRHDCNYFQRAENNIDGIHVRFAHHVAPGLGDSARGTQTPARISARETAWGVTQVLEYAGRASEENHFLMPNGSYFTWQYGAKGRRIHNRLWYVPIDDESHHLFVVTLVADEGVRRLMSAPRPQGEPRLGASVAEVLSGKSSFQGLDKSRPDLILLQDAIVTCGLGAISDRSREHLGQTDVAVILLRQLWRRELRALRAGKPPTPFAGSPLDLGSRDQSPA